MYSMFEILNEVEDSEVHLHNLIIHAALAQTESDQPSLQNILTDRGIRSKIVVDNSIISHVSGVAFMAMGQSTDFHLTNSVVKDFTSQPGGQFWGGIFWGAGFWMGTVDT